ncbi:tyrosine-protein phosphatase [Xylocopilactobacillus apicola]|uniref:Phosphatase n=1 Tax=Xylocopilactobacillus apicola TaxID=2932184 RepID=A0AAU9D124_9LACO|nr:tyrosine-protein phosphatase [Xylocopilactobacillus apicola]BDR58401.1 phosphatase [Xylocopilactobacillus apicola]
MKLVNFRDLGGIKNRNGQLVKHKRLLRSGEVVNVDQEVIDQLVQDYQLKQIVDLRSEEEFIERPDDKIPGVDLINLQIMKGAKTNGFSLQDFARIGDVSFVDDHMLNVYHDVVSNPISQEYYGNFLQLLIDTPDGSTLFHCFAGKDRTGIAAALILWLLDVENEEVVKDYLQTNVDRKVANDEIIDGFRREGYEGDELLALAVSLEVKEEYLEIVQNFINQNYGSVKKYAEEELNFDQSKVDKLQDLYLVSD